MIVLLYACERSIIIWPPHYWLNGGCGAAWATLSGHVSTHTHTHLVLFDEVDMGNYTTHASVCLVSRETIISSRQLAAESNSVHAPRQCGKPVCVYLLVIRTDNMCAMCIDNECVRARYHHRDNILHASCARAIRFDYRLLRTRNQTDRAHSNHNLGARNGGFRCV